MTAAAQIAEQLGLTESGSGFTGFCPSCGYETGFSVVDKGGRTLVHCHAGGCTQQQLIKVLREDDLWESQTSRTLEFPPHLSVGGPSPRRRASTVEAALAMWERAQPAPGTVVERYIRARGYFGPVPIALRYVSAKHQSDEEFHPAMLAAAILPSDPPIIVGVHRTFLLPDGSGKALLVPAKMSLGDLRGAGVPLSPLVQSSRSRRASRPDYRSSRQRVSQPMLLFQLQG
jgi:hypothetical protein